MQSDKRKLKNNVIKFVVLLIILINILGSLYYIYLFAFKHEFYYQSVRFSSLNAEKKAFSYYFFWYDNNSGGDVKDSLHMYNDPQNLPPDHPYYIQNNTLINESYVISADSYKSINITDEKIKFSSNPPDFDMLQTEFTSFENKTVNSAPREVFVYGLNVSTFNEFENNQSFRDNLPGKFKDGFTGGSHGYHRLDYNLRTYEPNANDIIKIEQDMGNNILIIQNPNHESVRVSIISSVHNDSNSHHPDGSMFDGDFSYKNVKWHKYEIENMIKAGIDVILPVYWGPWSGEWNRIGIHKLIEAYNELEGEMGIDNLPKIAMFMDTTGLLTYNGSKLDLTTASGKAVYSYFINDFYQMIPGKYLFKYNNREIVWMYGSNFIGDYDDTTFSSANSNYSAVFGEDRALYFVGTGFSKKTPQSLLAGYSWGISLNGAKVDKEGLPIGNVGPGFYSLGAVRHGWQTVEGLRVRERRNGDYLRESFNKVIPESKWVVIEVWNEYHEGNDISYSVEFKDFYMNITKEMISKFKSAPYIQVRESDYVLIGVLGCWAIIGVLLRIKRNLSQEHSGVAN